MNSSKEYYFLIGAKYGFPSFQVNSAMTGVCEDLLELFYQFSVNNSSSVPKSWYDTSTLVVHSARLCPAQDMCRSQVKQYSSNNSFFRDYGEMN